MRVSTRKDSAAVEAHFARPLKILSDLPLDPPDTSEKNSSNIPQDNIDQIVVYKLVSIATNCGY
jgi:hypothetical protein